MQRLLPVLLLSVTVLLRYGTSQEACTPPADKPGCVCYVEGQGTIDLTSITGNGDDPKFIDVPQSGSEFVYSYNPCYGFVSGYDMCRYPPVSACQKNPSNSVEYRLGDPETETMYYNSDTDDRYLQYDGGSEGRSIIVHLQCDETADIPELTANGDGETQLTYVFHLKTKCACPGGCTDETHAPPTTHGSSGGSSNVPSGYIGIILMVFLLAGLITYFVVGIIINHVRFEKRGVELIPQKYIWFGIPSLVKDGFVFTFGPFINKIRRSYDPI